MSEDIKVTLKRFGTIKINKSVSAHKHNNGLWHVFIFGDWHEVPESDVKLN